MDKETTATSTTTTIAETVTATTITLKLGPTCSINHSVVRYTLCLARCRVGWFLFLCSIFIFCSKSDRPLLLFIS